jgi:hypothetical protein
MEGIEEYSRFGRLLHTFNTSELIYVNVTTQRYLPKVNEIPREDGRDIWVWRVAEIRRCAREKEKGHT